MAVRKQLQELGQPLPSPEHPAGLFQTPPGATSPRDGAEQPLHGHSLLCPWVLQDHHPGDAWGAVCSLFQFCAQLCGTRAGSPALSCLSSAININDRGQVELSGCINYPSVPQEGTVAQHGFTFVWGVFGQPRSSAALGSLGALSSVLCPPCRAAGTAHSAQINHGKTQLPSKGSSKGRRAARPELPFSESSAPRLKMQSL